MAASYDMASSGGSPQGSSKLHSAVLSRRQRVSSINTSSSVSRPMPSPQNAAAAASVPMSPQSSASARSSGGGGAGAGDEHFVRSETAHVAELALHEEDKGGEEAAIGDDDDERTPLLIRKQPLGDIESGGRAAAADGDEARGSARQQQQPPPPPPRGGGLGKQHRSARQYIMAAIAPVHFLPAVMLGALLNVLDALSYGMILFPLGSAIFADTGADGISMFYVSCIVSQLVYSLGGSVFQGGIGSEMIEVVPFFHKMAFIITAELGEENKAAVLATTIVSFAISSIITGLVFFVLGAAGLGSFTGFFPRHLLVGCIGGVGLFLVLTGVEVASRISGSLTLTVETLHYLVQRDVLPLWLIPLVMSILLLLLEKRIDHPLTIPTFFTLVPFVFYIVVLLIPNYGLANLRKDGWVFDAPQANQPWWNFYTYYKFPLVDWMAVLKVFPVMLALTFFGILHVPINVPALGVTTQEDNLNVDRELIAHGLSNALSGMVGSIQNYLVYTNSLLFIRTGGNSRVAGVMLAIATAIIMMSGPAMVGYIPVMMVAALILLLGFSLLVEALVDTWGRVNRLEYLTIVTITISMAIWDFVYGILLGILLASFFFVIHASRKPVIRGTYSGYIVKSTVRRHPAQQKFLRTVGHQIYVCRLSGYLFFGTISGVEHKVRGLLDEANFGESPIRYLLMDFTFVNGLDYSAGETFIRMKRLVERRKVRFMFCGISHGSDVYKALESVGMMTEGSDEMVEVFDTINSGLEHCENDLLMAYYAYKSSLMPQKPQQNIGTAIEVPRFRLPVEQGSFGGHSIGYGKSPRERVLQKAASSLAQDERDMVDGAQGTLRQPLPLLMQIFSPLSDKNENFWFRLVPFMVREEVKKGTVMWRQGDLAEAFYLVEAGIIVATYALDRKEIQETIVAGTVCGELPFMSQQKRSASVCAERDCIVWKITKAAWTRIKQADKGAELIEELLVVGLKLTEERLNVFIQSSMLAST